MLKKTLMMTAALAALSATALAAGLETNGMTQVAPGSGYTILSPRALTTYDTGLAGGQPPQTVAASAFQAGAVEAEMLANPVTSTAGAATSNTFGGLITTEALTTAPGATYVFTLTDSLLGAPGALPPQFGMYSKSNTARASMAIQSIVVGTGSVVVTFVNQGTVALNGTMLIPFHV